MKFAPFKFQDMKTSLFIVLMILTSAVAAPAQDEQAEVGKIISEDSADVYKLATYPADVRLDIFVASTAPQALTDIQSAHDVTSQELKKLLSFYSMEVQRKVWNLLRYKGLVSQLVEVGKKAKGGQEDIVNKYPKSIRQDALNYIRHRFRLLEKVNDINDDFKTSFDNIIKPYPTGTQNALRRLLDRPEILSILNNMNITVRLGNLYKKNPDALVNYFTSLNAQLVQERQNALAAWKQTMLNDPQAQQEMEQAAKEYEQDPDYDFDTAYAPSSPADAVNFDCPPYPYWCGYPWWFDYEYWYPYPYWWDCGFYFWDGAYVWFGLPTWGFWHWTFWHSYHFYDYPHLVNAYIGFNHAYPRASPYGGVVVHQWLRENRQYLPKDFARNPTERVAALKEYGRVADEYSRYQLAGGDMSRSEFINQHATEYPHLQTSAAVQELRSAPAGQGGMRLNGIAPHEREEWINNGRSTGWPTFHEPNNFAPRGGGGFRGGGFGGFGRGRR